MNLNIKTLGMNRLLKAKLRSHLFHHLEGIPIVAIVSSLNGLGILDFIYDRRSFSLEEIASKYNCNKGYLAVALRILCSQGYLRCHFDSKENQYNYILLDKAPVLLKNISSIDKVFESYPILKSIAQAYGDKKKNSLESDLKALSELIVSISVLDDVDRIDHLKNNVFGPIISSLLVHLGMNEVAIKDNKFSMKISKPMMVCLELLKFGEIVNNEFILNKEGEFYLKRSSAYGVTVSYLQTFIWMRDLLVGKGDILWDKPDGGEEIHVDRTMNVWGSGGAHSAYFRKIDEIVIEMFNRPLDDQPKGIADMGCGNGAFLIHIYQTICEKTLRGRNLEKYPLVIVGSDYNEAAIKSSKTNFEKFNIKGHFLKGDIGKPELLAEALKEEFDISLEDMLSVRSFLDHNRIFENPINSFENRTIIGSGAFSFRGRLLDNREVEQNLYEHFLKWRPYVKKYGLLVIELHTIDTEVSSQNIGKTAISAYDATHGFTDQYIVEHKVFLRIAEEAGLFYRPNFQFLFPNEEMTTVSINVLRE